MVGVVEKLKEEGAGVVAAGVGKLRTEVGVLAGNEEKFKEEGAGVVAAGVEKVVVACVESTGGETLKEEIGGDGTVVKIFWGGPGAGDRKAVCAGAGGTGAAAICTGDDGS